MFKIHRSPKKRTPIICMNKKDADSSSKKEKETEKELEEKFGISLGGLLGQGSYCKVKSATYKGEEVAVKIIAREKLSVEFETKFLPREIELLSKISHENIVKVHIIFSFQKKIYIVMELIKDDLLSYVKDRGRLREKEARLLFSQIVSAIRHLHKLNFAHRDLKCENIMIDDGLKIKIIDFGFCRSVADKQGRRKLSETYCGSTAYAAPEVLQGLPYNPMFYDVWSLGCVLYIMTTGNMPFDDSHVRKMVHHQLKGEINFPSNINLSNTLKNLIKNMLEPDLTKRFTMEIVSRSPWLKETGEPEDKPIVRISPESGKKKYLVTKATLVSLQDKGLNESKK